MSKPRPHDWHRQCKLRKGDTVTYSWIPAIFSVKGKKIGLRDEKGAWEEGWVVEEVWTARKTTDVLEQAEYFKSHREGTDAYRGKDEEGKTKWDTPNSR